VEVVQVLQEMHNQIVMLMEQMVVQVEVEVKIHHHNQQIVEVQETLLQYHLHKVIMEDKDKQQLILQVQEVEVEPLQLDQTLQE
jgi:hypothetical protein